MASFLILVHVIMTDFKSRYVHLVTMLVLLLITIARMMQNGSWQFWEYYLLNLAFTSMLLLISVAVVAKKNGINWKDVIGVGDLVFLFLICFWFDTMTFVTYFNVSLVLALVAHVSLKKLQWYRAELGVPFAGYFAFSLMFFLVIQ